MAKPPCHDPEFLRPARPAQPLVLPLCALRLVAIMEEQGRCRGAFRHDGVARELCMADGPIERLKAGIGSFTKAEEAAALYFIDHPASVRNKTIASVAKEAGLTTTGIMRMCQRAGYSGYAEFRFSMNRYLISHGAGQGDEETDTPVSRLADVYSSYLRKTTDGLDVEQLGRIARLITGARRISIWGCNRTYESVMQLSLRLLRIGIFNQTTSDPQVMDDISTILGEGDLCIVMSMNGRGTRSYPALMTSLVERGCDVVLVTMNPKIGLIRHATEAVLLPWISNDYSAGFLEDQLIVFMYVECLLNEIAGLVDGPEFARG